MTQTQQDAPCPNLVDFGNHLPGPARPVQDVAMWHDGKRYGGFTSVAHAHQMARRLGWTKYEIREPSGAGPEEMPR